MSTKLFRREDILGFSPARVRRLWKCSVVDHRPLVCGAGGVSDNGEGATTKDNDTSWLGSLPYLVSPRRVEAGEMDLEAIESTIFSLLTA